MVYDDIRAALSRGFFVANLNLITRLGHDALTSDEPCRHPSAVYALAITAQKIALRWEGVPLADDAAAIVEAHILPKMLAVIDAADGPDRDLIAALDALARAYADAVALI